MLLCTLVLQHVQYVIANIIQYWILNHPTLACMHRHTVQYSS